MAVIKISKKCLCALSGICADEAEPILTEIGIPIDSQIGDIMSLEITPNRPDWLSVEGIARSCHSYKFATAKQYEAQKSKISFKTTPAIKKVRPFLGSALVKNVNLNDEILDSLIQLQEKLHDTLGRQRKKMAIGLHDVSKVESPFTYTAQKLEEESFTPLGMQSPLTFNQILFQHEKGKKYAHLVGDLCPVIKDKNNEVLSFPPIINGELTKVTKKTTDLLIDCTGTHGRTVQVAVNILAAAFADWGAQIYSVQIDGKPYPIFEPIQTSFSSKDANSLLGLNLSDAQLKHHLARMGHTLKGKNVFSPAFRADIIGATDLIEDIAISYGYNNFKPSLPDFVSIGKLAPVSAAHESAIGLGYFEVSSWILTNKKTLEKSQI
ncbi:MAG: phenylalanine--tRNA ligase subunit beta, partial [Candidatus Micrarchaeia archaeon]